jgi:hypothetical protein
MSLENPLASSPSQFPLAPFHAICLGARIPPLHLQCSMYIPVAQAPVLHAPIASMFETIILSDAFDSRIQLPNQRSCAHLLTRNEGMCHEMQAVVHPRATTKSFCGSSNPVSRFDVQNCIV